MTIEGNGRNQGISTSASLALDEMDALLRRLDQIFDPAGYELSVRNQQLVSLLENAADTASERASLTRTDGVRTEWTTLDGGNGKLITWRLTHRPAIWRLQKKELVGGGLVTTEAEHIAVGLWTDYRVDGPGVDANDRYPNLWARQALTEGLIIEFMDCLARIQMQGEAAH